MADSYSWGPVPVSPEEIEASLSQLWARDALSGASRLCTANLIVFLEDKVQEEQTYRVLAKLVATNPGRVLIIAPVTGPQELRAYVSARCEPPADRSGMVCCDQVLLETDRSLIAKAVSIVSEVLVAELPVFVWWRGDPLDSAGRSLDLLKGLVTRLVFDSQEFSSLGSFVRARQMAIELASPQGDLNWGRLAPWRAAAIAALTAEEASIARREFHTLKFSLSEPGNLSQPLLYFSWIAALLGLEPLEVRWAGDGLSLLLQGGRSFSVVWQAEPGVGPPSGGLTGLELAGIDHSFSVRRTQEGACLECNATVHGRSWHSVLASADLSLHQLLSLELSQFGEDEELEQCLKVMLQLLDSMEIGP